MLRISEWLPDPAGQDTAEWIELWNDGDHTIDLFGWHLRTTAAKIFPLRGAIPPRGYLVLHKSEFKFALRNSDGAAALYDPAGRLASEGKYLGQAPTGQSVNLTARGAFFGVPTPGVSNARPSLGLLNDAHPLDVPLQPSSFLAPLAMMLGAAAVLTAIVLYAIRQYDRLSELFFGEH